MALHGIKAQGSPSIMRIKVHGGTAPNPQSSLCRTCRYATVVKGHRLGDEIVECVAGLRDPHLLGPQGDPA